VTRFVVLTAVTSVSKVIAIFLSKSYLSTQPRSFLLCSDLSHTLYEKATPVKKLARDGFASKRSITNAILGLFQEAYKPAGHAYSAIVDSFFFFMRNIIFCSIIVY